MKYTRRELRAILALCAENIGNMPPDSHCIATYIGDVQLTWFGVTVKPHTTVIVAASCGDARAMHIGVSTCGDQDEWNGHIGHRIAMDKALDGITHKLMQGGSEMTVVPEGESLERSCSRSLKVLVEDILYPLMKGKIAWHDPTD